VIPTNQQVLLKIEDVCASGVTFRKRLRFGKISQVGNLEKLPEAAG
jgi:hypothetical protein